MPILPANSQKRVPSAAPQSAPNWFAEMCPLRSTPSPSWGDERTAITREGERALMRTGQRTRQDVQPMTWELPAAAVAATVAGMALMLPAGQGAAGLLFGRGWAWPHGSKGLLASLGGLLSGHPGRGLTTVQAARIPAAGAVYLLIVVGELLLLAAAVYAAVLWWRHLGPGAHQGMADRVEAETVLGLSGLRKARKVIRPDLYRASADGKGRS